jgi:cell shape-determining protein MreD
LWGFLGLVQPIIMTILFYILVSLFLVIIRTTLMPILPIFEKFYDLLIPIVIFLGFFRSKREGIPVVMLMGLIMDGLSGGPMGLYLIIYVWLYIGVRWAAQVFSTGSLFMLTLAILIGVAGEIVVLLGYMIVLSSGATIPPDALKTIVMQLIWAMATGPVIMVMMGMAQKRLDRWRTKILVEW